MIRTHVNDINPDIYCYDTGLTFGLDAADKILAQVKQDETLFERRNNYYRDHSVKGLIRQVGAEKTRELLRRGQQTDKLYPGHIQIEFKQYFLNNEFGKLLLSQTPDWLKISPTEPDPMLQISENGNMLRVHKGHYRRCSLFMLLESDGQETRWYRNTEPFEIIDAIRIPDMDKIEQVVSVVMEPRRWYLFNHFEWHSVHKFTPGRRRISIGVDFNSIDAAELLQIIKANA